MKEFKIINYPPTLEAAHALIDVLIDELNDYKAFVLEDADDCCTPYKMVKGSSTPVTPPPAGVAGEWSNNVQNIFGGVKFENDPQSGVSWGPCKISHTTKPHSDAARGVFITANTPQNDPKTPIAGF